MKECYWDEYLKVCFPGEEISGKLELPVIFDTIGGSIIGMLVLAIISGN
jgi:hypothetical protein